MAGLDPSSGVYRDQRITKIEIPSNPVFIGVSSHPFDVAYYKRKGAHTLMLHPSLFFVIVVISRDQSKVLVDVVILMKNIVAV